MNWIKNKWHKIEATPKKVREFGLILSVILLVLGGIAFWRGHHQWKFEWPLSAVFLFLTLVLPNAMFYVYKTWMMAAEAISWVVLRVLLGALFYVVLSPVSVTMRLLKKDILDQNLDPSKSSYWNKRTVPVSRERYEKLF